MARRKSKKLPSTYGILALVGCIAIIVGCIMPVCGAPILKISTSGVFGENTEVVNLGDNLFQFIFGYDVTFAGSTSHVEGLPAFITCWICLACAGVLTLVGSLASIGKVKTIGSLANILGGLLAIGASVPFFFYKNFLNLEDLPSFSSSLLSVNAQYSMGTGIILLAICCIAGGAISTAIGTAELAKQ